MFTIIIVIIIVIIISSSSIIIIIRLRSWAAVREGRPWSGAQGKQLHIRNHKHEIPLENTTESPLDNSDEHPLGR